MVAVTYVSARYHVFSCPGYRSATGRHLRVVECRLTRRPGVAHQVREGMARVDTIRLDIPRSVLRFARSAWSDDNYWDVSMSAIAILYKAEPCSRRRWPVSHSWPASRAEVS